MLNEVNRWEIGFWLFGLQFFSTLNLIITSTHHITILANIRLEKMNDEWSDNM